eukprot:3602835-Rhodomonas_salina.1
MAAQPARYVQIKNKQRLRDTPCEWLFALLLLVPFKPRCQCRARGSRRMESGIACNTRSNARRSSSAFHACPHA